VYKSITLSILILWQIRTIFSFFLGKNFSILICGELCQFVNTPGLEVRRASSQQQVVGMPIKATKNSNNYTNQ